MILERADLYRLSMPLVRPFRTSFGQVSDRHCTLIRLQSEGEVGWGECVAGSRPSFSYETASTAWVVLREHFLPSVLGREFLDVGALLERLHPFRGHPLARAGLEMSFWDLIGRGQGRSLQRLLGGSGDEVVVGVSVGIQGETGELVERVAQFLELGYRRVKIKIAPGRDIEPTRSIRAAFSDLALQVDANAAYSLDDLPIFEALDELDLLMIEQPLHEDDLLDHSRLQSELGTPICLDESIRSVRQARQALQMGACRVVNIKQARVGGVTEALRIHDLCAKESTPVWCGGMLETGLGRAANLALASLPGFTLPGDISATERYYERDIAQPTFELRDGCLQVPQGPGLGVEVQMERVEEFALQKDTVEPG